MPYRIECVLECANHLGEGPIWDVEEGRLYWVDGTGRRVGNPSIWRLDPRTGRTETWSLAQDVGALALRRGGGAVLALDDGFYFFEFDGGRLECIGRVEGDQPRSRLNDGKCDRRGRFFAGGMDDKEELKICGLYRLDPDLRVTKVDDGIICTNGPCWSPDDRTFYVGDTSSRSSGLTTTTSRPEASAIVGCSPPRTTIPASPTAPPSTRRAACGMPR
jgi:L-arabinonolactonase